MVAGSILPVSFNEKGELVFLFGKENPLENSSKGWSDFGGGCEHGETPYQTALREGGEELTFFLGDSNDIKHLIRKNGGIFPMVHDTYYIHCFYIEYDPKLPIYYNNNHKHLWKHMNREILNKSKLFEKIEIRWFTVGQIRRNLTEFRRFYQDIVKETILPNVDEIRDFIR